MQILFVDESGTPPPPGDARSKYFVMGGVIIPESVWHRIRDALLGMKIRRKIRGEIKWRYFAPGNEEAGNLLRKLDQNARDEVRSEVYKIVTSEKAIKSIVAVCSIAAAYRMQSGGGQQDIYNLTYKALTERFQYFLQDLKKETGTPEYGLIIGDHRGRDDDRKLRAHHQMLVHAQSAVTSKYSNLIESLLLQPSNLSIGIQLADMISGATWRKFERGDERWFKLMEPSLRRGPAGQIDGYGLVKVPKAGWV